MTLGPKRRRLHFSLRTLLAVTSLLGMWLGWNVHQVQERKRLMQDIAASGGHCAMGERFPYEKTSVPLVWSALGAEFVGYIVLPVEAFSTQERARVQALFPEAMIGRCVETK